MIELTLRFLMESALVGTLILLLVTVAVRLLREPAMRTAVIACGLLAAVAVPAARVTSALPRLSIPLLPAVDSSSSSVLSSPVGAFNASDLDSPRPDFADPEAIRPAKPTIAIEQHDTGAVVNGGKALPTADTRAVNSAVTWAVVCTSAYVLGVAALLVRLLVGHIRLARLIKASVAADERLARSMTHLSSNRAATTLRISDRIDGPIVCGVWRPTIVLPKSLAESGDSEAIRYALAHEWSHVMRHDLWSAMVANAAAVVLWWNPLVHWLRKQLLINQDFIADAAAAREANEPADYASYLLSLATLRLQPSSALAMAATKSRLSHRIQRLLGSPSPLLKLSPVRRACVLIVVFGCAASLAALQLVAQEKPAAVPVDATDSSEAAGELADEGPRTIGGTVLAEETGEPIANARVVLHRYLKRHPQTGRWTLLARTEHVTDGDGLWTAEIPQEQWSQPALYFNFQIHHPDYESFPWTGSTASKEWKKLSEGKQPWFTELKLLTSTPVTGRLIDSNGKPVSHATIRGRTFGEKRFTGSWLLHETDDEGRFRVPVAKDRPVVLCWYPPNWAPLERLIDRGDVRELGDVVCEPGAHVRGQVTDATGDPVEGVWVNVRSRDIESTTGAYLQKNSVANFVVRAGQTDANGHYNLAPLPPGSYGVSIDTKTDEQKFDEPSQFDGPSLNHTFLRDLLVIREGEPAVTKDVQAYPHVVVKGRFFGSDGKPRGFYAQDFAGKIGDAWFFGNSTVPLDDGWFEFRVPKGVTNPHIDWMTDAKSPLRFRVAADQPWQHGRNLYLDTINNDIDTIEVMRFEAPILTLKVVNRDGETINGAEIKAVYASRPMTNSSGGFIATSKGDVHFESKGDGQWESDFLLPDEETTVTVTKGGYQPASATVTLKEGETREIVVDLLPE